MCYKLPMIGEVNESKKEDEDMVKAIVPVGKLYEVERFQEVYDR